MIIEADLQDDKQNMIFNNEADMRDTNTTVKGHEEEQEVKAKIVADKMHECELVEIDSDAIIQVAIAKEELVNIQRLNSLLIALGDDASEACTDVTCDCIKNQGTCTWWTRGASFNTAWQHEQGQGILCS